MDVDWCLCKYEEEKRRVCFALPYSEHFQVLRRAQLKPEANSPLLFLIFTKGWTSTGAFLVIVE
jgi:hypothetical protein